MGLIAFSGVANSPRYESFHVLDIIRLMAAGANFGIAFLALILFFVFRRQNSEDKRVEETSGAVSN
jgi:hypothetical protein